MKGRVLFAEQRQEYPRRSNNAFIKQVIGYSAVYNRAQLKFNYLYRMLLKWKWLSKAQWYFSLIVFCAVRMISTWWLPLMLFPFSPSLRGGRVCKMKGEEGGCVNWGGWKRLTSQHAAFVLAWPVNCRATAMFEPHKVIKLLWLLKIFAYFVVEKQEERRKKKNEGKKYLALPRTQTRQCGITASRCLRTAMEFGIWVSLIRSHRRAINAWGGSKTSISEKREEKKRKDTRTHSKGEREHVARARQRPIMATTPLPPLWVSPPPHPLRRYAYLPSPPWSHPIPVTHTHTHTQGEGKKGEKGEGNAAKQDISHCNSTTTSSQQWATNTSSHPPLAALHTINYNTLQRKHHGFAHEIINISSTKTHSHILKGGICFFYCV